MRFLLDTHAFIWWASEPHKLSEHALELLQRPEHRFFLSLASVWEMQIKAQLGKLTLPPLADLITAQTEQNGTELLPIRLEHILGPSALEPHHKDPFDRLLVVQARAETLTLLSRDPIFDDYDVAVQWQHGAV